MTGNNHGASPIKDPPASKKEMVKRANSTYHLTQKAEEPAPVSPAGLCAGKGQEEKKFPGRRE